MTKITIEPIARLATPGSVSHFRVRVRGNGARTLVARPCRENAGHPPLLQGRKGEVPVGSGAMSLSVYTPAGAPMS